jgi:uncharacterized membrane protein
MHVLGYFVLFCIVAFGLYFLCDFAYYLTKKYAKDDKPWSFLFNEENDGKRGEKK